MQKFGVIFSLRSLATSVFSVALLFFIFSFSGCKKNDKPVVEHGAGQAATAQEKEEQNRNLIDQVVQATERQENYPDLTFLRGALSRLNSWLAESPVSPDFEPDAEYEALALEFEALVENSKEADRLVKKFADEKQTPTDEDVVALQSCLDKLSDSLKVSAEKLHSNALATFVAFVNELRSKLANAKEFQFADQTETFQTQIRQLVQLPAYQFYNFEGLANGLEEFAALLKIDGKTYLPQDAGYLRDSIWARDVFYWAKGEKQDDLVVVLSLFDWTVKNIAPSSNAIGQAGPISQTLWQTLLLGQGTAMDRALVFIELLRQHRLDAFVLTPENAKEDSNFPLVVGVRLNDETYLFLPQYGLPIPALGNDSLTLDSGLKFNKIATLNDVAQDDSLLRQFDLVDAPFPAKSQDFEKMVANVSSTPFVVAARMIPLEREFSGSVNTVLSYSYVEQKKRVGELAHIVDVRRLHEAIAPILEQSIFPFESDNLTSVYTIKLEAGESLEVTDSTASTDESIADYTGNSTQTVDEQGNKKTLITPLWVGRVLYLRGGLSGDGGAGKYYMQCRASERILKQEEANVPKQVEQAVEMYKEQCMSQNHSPDENELRAFVAQIVNQFRVDITTKRFMKVLSSCYLAILTEASGNAEATLDRLADDSLRYSKNDAPNTVLGYEQRRAAAYLRARVLERLNKNETAIDRYRDLTQDWGANVRANWIAKLCGLPTDAEIAAKIENTAVETPASVEKAAPEISAPAETAPADVPAPSEEVAPEVSAPVETVPADAPASDSASVVEAPEAETSATPEVSNQTEQVPAETPAQNPAE